MIAHLFFRHQATDPYYVRFAQTKEQVQGHLRAAKAKRTRKEARRVACQHWDNEQRFTIAQRRWLNALNSCGAGDPVDGYEVVSATLEGDGPTLRVEVVQPVDGKP